MWKVEIFQLQTLKYELLRTCNGLFNIYSRHKINKAHMCVKSNLFEDGIIIHGNQATCSLKVVYQWNEMVLDCCRLPMHCHFHESNQEMCIWTKWDIAQPFDWRCTNLLLSKAKQYGGWNVGLSELWWRNHVDQVLIPVLETPYLFLKLTLYKKKLR
jgi:hypothetical protein